MANQSKHPTSLKLATLAEISKTETPTSPRKFRMAAYTGAPVQTWIGAMVIDLAGLSIGEQKKPILRQHDPNRIAGFSESIKIDSGLLIEGTLSSSTESGKEIAALSDEGFPWQASVGIDIGALEELMPGGNRTVNGRTFNGPGYIVTQSSLRESSFVPLGADGATSAVALEYTSGNPAVNTKDKPMNLESFKQFASEHPEAVAEFTASGMKAGEVKGKAETIAMLEAFPADLAFALAQAKAGRTIDEAKAIRLEIETANAKLIEENKQLQVRLAASTTGQAVAPVATAGAPTAPDSKAAPDGSDPKALAKWEWAQGNVTGFSSEDRYVSARVAELTGKLRIAKSK